MKKALIMVIGMTALCLYGTTLEEARRILREGVEGVGPLDTPEKRERADKIWTDLVFLGLNEGYLALSVYCELLAEHSDNPKIVDTIMKQFRHIGERSTEAVNQDALDWARKVAVQEESRYDGARAAKNFLSYKGDAKDMNLMSRSDDKKRLATRAAGTNVVEWFDRVGHPPKDNYFHFIPSVTNTGPQALYAREILHRYWEMLPEEVLKREDTHRGITHRLLYRDGSKIPAELLTLVVWFDEDGNPVCNVDLAKYGLTMPEIGLPQNVKDEILRRVRPNAAAEPLPLTGDDTQRPEAAVVMGNPPSRLWIYAGVISVLCAGAVLWCLRKKR